jgi:hypothetical protein
MQGTGEPSHVFDELEILFDLLFKHMQGCSGEPPHVVEELELKKLYFFDAEEQGNLNAGVPSIFAQIKFFF